MSIIVNSMWGFVFALMKCSYAAFGEQNKIDNDCKCQQGWKFKGREIKIGSLGGGSLFLGVWCRAYGVKAGVVGIADLSCL